MTDIKELFDMVTKQTEPDLDSWKEQEDRQRRSTRNKKAGAYAVAAVFVLLATLAFVSLRGGEGDDRTPTTGDGTSELSSSPAVPALTGDLQLIDIATAGVSSGPELGDEVSGHFTASPDGTMVAYVASSTDGEIVHVANIDGSGVRAFPETRSPHGALSPSWSPDGSTVVYHASERGVGNLFLLEVASGDVSQLTDLEPVPIDFWLMTPTFVSGGDAVVFVWPTATGGGALRGDLWSIPVTGGDPILIHRTAGFVDASPDGSRITFTEFNIIDESIVVGDLWISDADGSHSERLVDGEVTMSRMSPDGSRVTYADEQLDELMILDLVTGETVPTSWPAQGNDWIDDGTLLVEP